VIKNGVVCSVTHLLFVYLDIFTLLHTTSHDLPASSQNPWTLMVGRALSEHVKKAKRRRTDNAILQEAVDAFHQNRERPEAMRESERAIARRFGVSPDTVRRHANGGVSMSAFNASKQKLSPPEERVVIDHICASADRGFPLAHKAVVAHANAIIEARNGETIDPDSNWIDRFISRHRQELQAHWSRPLDTQRARALNPAAVSHWFGLVKEHIADPDIRPEDVYGMDESGFALGDQGRQRVIGRRGTKVQHKQGGGDKENVTVIVTICADGTYLKPTIIMKGQNIQKKWGENNIAGAS
jgi:hypothetical protein